MSASLSLHKAVFSGDTKAVEEILKNLDQKELDSQDIHGNTALHIAVMKGNIHCVELLIGKGAITTIRNELNWMSLHEAISYGDFQIIKILNDSLTKRVIKYLKRDFMFKIVNDIKENFILKFEARIKDYKTTSFMDPSELKIFLSKKGLKIRADITISDCFHTRLQNFHIIFDLNSNSSAFIKIFLEDLPFYQTITYQEWEETLIDILTRESRDEEVRELMERENIAIKMDRNGSESSDRPSFKKVITKKIAGHRTDIYVSQDIDMTTKIRTEHLIARDQLDQSVSGTNRSLPKPVAKNVSWEEYIESPKGLFPNLGRDLIERVDTNRVSIVIGLTDEISLDWKWILDFVQQVLSNKLTSLISNMSNELPNGFPVVIDFPLKASLYLKWKLISLEIDADIDDFIFNIPENFHQRHIFRIERDH